MPRDRTPKPHAHLLPNPPLSRCYFQRRSLEDFKIERLCTLATTRHVTGVTWLGDELWHGTWEGDASDLRRIDPATGAVLDTLELPQGVGVSGLESDGRDWLFCGGGSSGKLRVVRRSRDVANTQDADAPA